MEGTGKGGSVTFKRILLNKCQVEFEKEKTDEQQLEKEKDTHFENVCPFIPCMFLKLSQCELRDIMQLRCPLPIEAPLLV